MEKYSIVKLRSYLVHLIIGAAVLILGGSVLYSILSEMIQVYDPGSKYAYIFGIIACALILLIGLFFIIKAFGFENQVFKHVALEDRAGFFEELGDEQTLFFDRYLFVTRHYILVYVKSWNPFAKLLRVDDLIGCFGKPYYAGSDELVQYDVIFCDRDFHLYRCEVKGKKAAMMEEAWKAVCSLAPWVFHDDYVDFVAGLTKKSKKRSYVKIVEHRKKLEEVSEDTIQNAVISAADVIKSFNEQAGRRDKKAASAVGRAAAAGGAAIGNASPPGTGQASRRLGMTGSSADPDFDGDGDFDDAPVKKERPKTAKKDKRGGRSGRGKLGLPGKRNTDKSNGAKHMFSKGGASEDASEDMLSMEDTQKLPVTRKGQSLEETQRLPEVNRRRKD